MQVSTQRALSIQVDDTISTALSVQRQARHVLNSPLYNSGGYFRDAISSPPCVRGTMLSSGPTAKSVLGAGTGQLIAALFAGFNHGVVAAWILLVTGAVTVCIGLIMLLGFPNGGGKTKRKSEPLLPS